MDKKRIAGEYAARFVEDGMLVGLGTGSTAYWAIRKLGERVRAGLDIRAVPTSNQSEQLAREWGIPLIGLHEAGWLDITIDGADEIDANFHLIKGGGALYSRLK